MRTIDQIANSITVGVGCYVLVEHSTQRELGGHNFDASHIVLEAYASDTL